ncbi:heparanase [Pieris rapae]|uniref:heparanase n=1 Tax=Pieris rapae TaxID=64459 RepID=UPI001E27B52E|nr:heparanase [Pieris rapae]
MLYLHLLVFCFSLVNSTIYNVKIFTDNYVNLVDRRFLSLSVDPKDLFSFIGKYNSKECSCMASALTPAFLRIAGPSTEHLTFKNNTFAIDNQPRWQSKDDHITVTRKQWEKFIKSSNTTGFDLVFALNSDQKTKAGIWDANTALDVLTTADRLDLANVFWQLGYECKNQSIEEYLNDLETLKVITETFSRPGWKVVGGDVTPCLHLDSKSDFADYVTLSNDVMDALFLNGNSSSQELERMSEKDRRKLLKVFAKSQVPLWLTERTHTKTELHRAAEWLASLGFAARNGFSIHYRDLLEEELHEPTLSFYMALLFKNLVGERVLDVDIDVTNATLFAHCTSLGHKPIPGALTLYGANMDDEPARFSIKLPKNELGGDIMQFVLSLDKNQNIVVNSHAMYYEGDIRPVVKHVRPYKSLLISLPPKSFGFWVLANTQVQACRDLAKDTFEDSVEEVVVLSEEEPSTRRIKRSDLSENKLNGKEILDQVRISLAQNKAALRDRVYGINKDLQKMHTIFQAKRNKNAFNRLRRESRNSHEHFRKPRRKFVGISKDLPFSSNLISKILDVTSDFTRTKDFLKKNNKNSVITKINKRRRYSEPTEMRINRKGVDKKINTESLDCNHGLDINNKKLNDDLQLQRLDGGEDSTRKRRSIARDSLRKYDEVDSLENAIDLDSKENRKFSKIFDKVKKLGKLPMDIALKNDDYENTNDNLNAIVLETKIEDDGAIIKISENPNSKIISTLEDVISFFSNVNKKLKRVWDMTTLLD